MSDQILGNRYSGELYKDGEVISSDVRFGAAFLDVEHADKAAPGEVLRDPMTGELFTRRVIDGRLVSFSQKSHNIFEFLSEFNVQFQSAYGFKYPKSAGTYLVGTRFNADRMATHSYEDHINVLTESISLPKDINSDNNLVFNVSNETNGGKLS